MKGKARCSVIVMNYPKTQDEPASFKVMVCQMFAYYDVIYFDLYCVWI